ncbi:MAG: alpha/beta fold hydrolase [Capnocytophaga sp.]|nr:alpha/beta fold hydrolase [Capnocytophaga sp.]
MPILTSTYRPPIVFRQPDVATIYSGRVRRVEGVTQIRERLELSDGDFLDVDWTYSNQKTKRCVILLHGLEGSAKRPYILGVAKHFTAHGYDACAMNYRGCGEEDNRLYATYHSAKKDDLHTVVEHVIEQGYQEIVLNGFSMGGNISLYYAGTTPHIPKEIKAVIAVSTPCDLGGCSQRLLSKRNFVYSFNFLRSLKKKIRHKQELFPELLTKEQINAIQNLKEFDDVYTSKAHGFKDADDYYRRCSSLPVLKNITLPVLLLNARNDSFLSKSCYPYKLAKKMPNLYLETPQHGGHVAFVDKNNLYYNEKRALEFANTYCSQ